MRPHGKKLVHTGISTKNRPIIDGDMTTQTHVIRKYSVTSDNAVMGHMPVSHHQIIVSDLGIPSSGTGPSMQRDPFPEHIVVTNFQPGLLSLKFLICRIFSHRAKLVKAIVRANYRVGADYHMGLDDRTGTNSHSGANNTPGTNSYAFVNFRFRINLRLIADHVSPSSTLRSAQRIFMVPTSSSPTEAFAANR